MNEEPYDSVVAGTLEQLEQRYPQLANLVQMRTSRSPSRGVQRDRRSAAPLEPTNPSTHPVSASHHDASHAGELSHGEQQVMAKWMQSHYDRLAEKLMNIDPKFPI